MNKIELDYTKMTTRENIHKYLAKLFSFPSYYGRNLDALYDCLCEIDEDTQIILDKDTIYAMIDNTYAYKVLIVFGKACEDNPHLNILFRP